MDGANGDGSSESLNDIQSYLANFNKEISSNGQQTFILTSATGEQLYEQANGDQDGSADSEHEDNKLNQPLLTPAPPSLDDEGDSEGYVPNPITTIQPSDDPDPGYIQGETTHLMVTAGQTGVVTTVSDSGQGMVQVQEGPPPQLIAVQPDANTGQSQLVTVVPDAQTNNTHLLSPDGLDGSTSDGSVVLNSNNQNYQTVTIVPSEVNQGGEVSYVLIVSQPEEGKDESGNLDMSVYDFKEEAKGVDDEDTLEEEESPNTSIRKVVRVTPRRSTSSQIQSQLMCNYCNYTSPKRYLLTRHMKTHSEERPHKCHICDRGFKTLASLQNHINTHTGVRPHKCKECDAAFTTSGELVRHVRYRHTFEKPHKCSECDYASVELSKLKRHLRSHTGERPYQCPHCTYASPDTYKLKRHLRIHTGEKPYECDICHTRFTQSNSLKAHKLIHTGNKPIFQCELCPTTCGRKTDLKIHVQKLHTSERPLQCKKCGKSFPDRYTYKIHLKTHEGEKCFKCELCPYAALSQRHLESHILTHTGEKPFSCDECDQSFRQKQLLRRHKNLYHTPDYTAPAPRDKAYECSECHRTFAHRGNLMRHMAMHDPDNPEYQALLDLAGSQDLTMKEEHDLDMVQSLADQQLELVGVDGSQTVVVLQSVHPEDMDAEDAMIIQQQGDEEMEHGIDTPHRQNSRETRGRVIAYVDEYEAEAEEEEEENQEQVEEEEEVEEEVEEEEVEEVEEEIEEEVEEEVEAELEEDEILLEEILPEEEPEPEPPVEAPVTPVKRGRGRPPKTPKTPLIQIKIEKEETVSPRPSRGARRKIEPSPEVVVKPKRGRRSSTRQSGVEPEEKKRSLQKRKDIETCFGFDAE